MPKNLLTARLVCINISHVSHTYKTLLKKLFISLIIFKTLQNQILNFYNVLIIILINMGFISMIDLIRSTDHYSHSL